MSQERQIAAIERRLRQVERREGVLAALFADTATSVNDVLRVVVPGYDGGEHLHGDPDGVVWEPRVADNGSRVYPQAEDPAYVTEADDGTWIVVAWKPA